MIEQYQVKNSLFSGVSYKTFQSVTGDILNRTRGHSILSGIRVKMFHMTKKQKIFLTI
jgi:hypothetical protein